MLAKCRGDSVGSRPSALAKYLVKFGILFIPILGIFAVLATFFALPLSLSAALSVSVVAAACCLNLVFVNRLVGARERRVRTAVDSVPVLIWTYDLNGCCTWQNRTFRDYTGMCEAQALADGWTAVVHPQERLAALKAIGGAVQAGAPVHFEMRIKRADGAYRWMSVTGAPYRGRDGNPAEYTVAGTNISEERELRDSLASSRQHLSDLLESSPVGLFEMDPSGACVFVNRRWEQLTGFTAAQAMGEGGYRAFIRRIARACFPRGVLP